jgi:RNA polymerase sigma-70 factor (ECF subfamily)
MEEQFIHLIIEKSKQGDEKAFRQLVEHYQYMIYTVSFRLLCNEEDARDITQETFIRTWTNLGTYHPDKKFSTWIYSIASHLCLDRLKAPSRNMEASPTDDALMRLMAVDDVEKQLINDELCNIIRFLTQKLTPKQRIVFTLHDLEGLELNEVIEITGMTKEKIKSNLYLARQFMRQRLEKY